MSEENKVLKPEYDLNAKWDACLDLSVRRFVYASAAGAFTGLLFFRQPVEALVQLFASSEGFAQVYNL
ncbi:MICOS complex subunit MIC10-like protein, partial [Tanacetum coccineum]